MEEIKIYEITSEEAKEMQSTVDVKGGWKSIMGRELQQDNNLYMLNNKLYKLVKEYYPQVPYVYPYQIRSFLKEV